MDSLSSLSRELVDARRFSSDLQGANRPPSQRPGVSSLRQRFAAAAAGPLCLGDNHTPSHLTSLPQIRPDAHFAKGGDSPPPHKNPRLPVEFRLMMSANPLRFSYYRTKGRVTRSTVALPHGPATRRTGGQ